MSLYTLSNNERNYVYAMIECVIYDVFELETDVANNLFEMWCAVFEECYKRNGAQMDLGDLNTVFINLVSQHYDSNLSKLRCGVCMGAIIIAVEMANVSDQSNGLLDVRFDALVDYYKTARDEILADASNASVTESVSTQDSLSTNEPVRAL